MSYFQAGFMYPLKDPSYFDDDLGSGYSLVAVPKEYDPGPCWMIDIWPVNQAGEVHPGYAASPVPIRADDVVLTGARPVRQQLPTPEGSHYRFIN